MKKYILVLMAAFVIMLTGCEENNVSDTEITTEYTDNSDLEETETENETADEDDPDAELEKSLVGLWTNDARYINFKANNYFTAVDEDKSEYTGTYSLVSNGKTIALALAENEDNIKTYTVEFEDDMKKLVLIDDNGDKTEYDYNEVKE